MRHIKFYSNIKIRIFGLALVLFGFQSHAQLSIGTTAPLFTASAALAGKEFTFSLSKSLSEGPVVVYFYPKAFTTGCTIEANLFAEAMDKFKLYGATVIGVSADDLGTLLKFSTGPCGGKFAVASDLDSKIMQSYGAAHKVRPNMADRISFVITPDQKVLFVISSMNPEEHVEKSLKALQTWRTNK
mgnify:CR=1 FL=1